MGRIDTPVHYAADAGVVVSIVDQGTDVLAAQHQSFDDDAEGPDDYAGDLAEPSVVSRPPESDIVSAARSNLRALVVHRERGTVKHTYTAGAILPFLQLTFAMKPGQTVSN